MIGNCESVETKETGWSKAIKELSNQIDRLRERVGVLSNRLEPLFCPEQSAKPESPTSPAPLKASAIIEIDSASFRIKELREMINEMLQKIEI